MYDLIASMVTGHVISIGLLENVTFVWNIYIYYICTYKLVTGMHSSRPS